MATYKITWAEVKKTGNTNGRDWQIMNMTLEDADGTEIKDVSTFEKVMSGDTIEGEIVKKGQYLNFEPKKVDNGRKPNMDRLMDKKASQIGEFQHNKATQIAEAQDRSAWMWAKTNASTLIGDSMSSASTETIANRVLDLATKIYNGEPTVPF